MTCFARIASIKVRPYAQRFSGFAPRYKKRPSFDISILFPSRSIPLRFYASHQHYSISYAKRAITKGLQCLEAGRGCAQAIPAA